MTRLLGLPPHRALAAITASPIPPNIFCELRLGTVLRACGFTLTELPEPKRRMNSYDSRLITFDANRPGIYHPIKGRVLPAPVAPK